LATKKIYIDINTPVEQWANQNRGVIMNSIYDNLEGFMVGKREHKTVIKLIAKPQSHTKLRENTAMIVDFSISKSDIDVTLEKVLEYMIEVEEYEKCAELVKIQKSLGFETRVDGK
jgi:hypothetical protein